MGTFRQLASLAALAALAGCDRALAPSDAARPSASRARAVVASATGGGRFLAASVVDVQFAFSAVLHGDGRASGRFHMYRPDLETTYYGAVTCVSFDAANRRAWIGGVLTRVRTENPTVLASPEQQVGKDVWFRVVDYGEGRDAPPDRSTVMGFEGAAGFITSEEYCAGKPWPEGDARTWPVTSGNIQVRP